MDETETDENNLSTEDASKEHSFESTHTLDTGTDSNQVIIVTDGSPRETNRSPSSNDGESPPTKRLCLAQDSGGHSYVLTLDAEGIERLQATGSCPELEHSLQTTVPQITSVEAPSNDSQFISESINQAWFTSREEKSMLQNKVGHMWKQGMWSKDEVELLQSNITQYCKDHDISDPAEVIFEMTKDERKDFYRTIAKGLNRPLFSVYRRVIRMYDNKNHQGKYSVEELEMLRELRAKHGNDWAAIGLTLGRSASSVKDRCRLMKDTCNTGKWLPEEENRLTESVYELASAMPGESVTQGLSWAAVAERVGTRSEKQCRTKWLNYLNWKQTGGSEWTREDDISLVVKVYNMNATDENQIDWVELSKDWPSVRSPQWLRGKWWSLKRHISDHQLLSFTEIVDTLHKLHTQNIWLRNGSDSARTRSSTSQSHVSVVQAPSLMQLPLQVQQEVSTHDNTDDDSNQGTLGTTYQAFEVLPSSIHLTQTGTPTFLIAQPSKVIPFSTSTTSSEPIIIHAIPTDSIQGNENVTVQMNTSSQIIISTSATSNNVSSLNCVDVNNFINVSETLGQSDEDINQLEHSDPINSHTESISEEISQSDLSNQADMSSHTDLDASDDSEIKDEISEGTDLNSEVSQSGLIDEDEESSDLAMVSSASLQFVQSSSGDGDLIHMSSLSGKQVLLEWELLDVEK